MTMTNEIDYFQLHNRKPREISIDMLDYEYVAKCEDCDTLKGILATLRSGKEGKYVALEEATENRLLDLMPSKERQKIKSMQHEPEMNEIHSATEDLNTWISQIQRQHEALQAQPKKKSDRSMRPIRGKAPEECPPIDNSSTTTAPKSNTSKPISAYDFRSWQKFDVDEALNEIDQQEQEAQAQGKAQRENLERRKQDRLRELQALPSAYQHLSQMSPVERAVVATREKQKGNECFKAGETEESITYYSRAIAFEDTNAVVYANRALAFLRLKNFQKAEEDCSRAISLDPTYLKARTRRGMARHRRGKYEGAIEDFEHVLHLNPENKEVAKLLQKTRLKWKETEGEQFQRFSIVEEDEEEQESHRPRIEIISERRHDDVDEKEKEKSQSNQGFQKMGILESSSDWSPCTTNDDQADEDDDLP